MKTTDKAVTPTNRIKPMLEDNGHASARIDIPKLKISTALITVVGKTPLIVHAWSAKAIRQMLDKQMGKATVGRDKKNPVEDFKQSMYYLPNKTGLGFPSICFKAAIVSAANDVDLKMTSIKRNVHVNSELVQIICDPLPESSYTEWDKTYEKEVKWEHSHGASVRFDMVRLESGVADIRFRGQFPKWKCVLEFEFNENVISLEQLVGLINAAGQGGIGEWRPSAPRVRSGEFGRFTVEQRQ